MLQALASHPGAVKSRNELMEAAYGDRDYANERTIDSHIKRLRRKFRAVTLAWPHHLRFPEVASGALNNCHAGSISSRSSSTRAIFERLIFLPLKELLK